MIIDLIIWVDLVIFDLLDILDFFVLYWIDEVIFFYIKELLGFFEFLKDLFKNYF